MAIFRFENNLLETVQKTTFNSEGILERQHLQAALKKQIDIISPSSLVISEEFSEWSESHEMGDGGKKVTNLTIRMRSGNKFC